MAYLPVTEPEKCVDADGKQINVGDTVVVVDGNSIYRTGSKYVAGELAQGSVSRAYFLNAVTLDGRKMGWLRANFVRVEGPPAPKECTCDITTIMRDGCTCGATKKYQQNELII